MGALTYKGRTPDSDLSAVTKGYTDTRYAAVAVDTDYVSEETADQATGLVTPTYVNAQDNLRAKKAAVDAADALYVPLTQKGAANGVAPLNTSTAIDSTYIASIETERKPIYLPPTSVALTATRIVTTVNAKEYQAATLNIADPGFPYIPLFFCRIGGASLDGVTSSRSLGTGSYGQISVLRSDDVKYAWGLCTATKVHSFHVAFPFADSTINPTTRPPLVGAHNFNLWLGLFSGTTYTFDPTGLVFYCLLMPGV